jgi:hypothetical protein
MSAEIAVPGLARWQPKPTFVEERPMGPNAIAEPVFDVVWPLAPLGVERQALAARLPTLDGATIGFLWDDMFRGDELFPVLEVELRKRFSNVTFVGYGVFGNTHGPDEAAVVAGIGDKIREHGVTAVVSAMGC